MQTLFLLYLVLVRNALSATYETCDCDNECNYDTITSDYVNCNSQRCCQMSDFTVTGNMWCFGHMSCYNSDISTTNAGLSCAGYQACNSATIAVTGLGRNTACSGSNGCKSASITSGNDISCSGSYGCNTASLSPSDDLECTGSYGCKDTTITAGDDIQCYGNYACDSITINSADRLYCNGYYSCYQSTITNVDYVTGYGYYSLKNAIIDNNGLSSTLNIYLRGYYAGNGLSIYCRNGEVACKITCDAYGCKGTTIYYEDINDVTILPSDISVACRLSMFQNTYYDDRVWCPTLTNGIPAAAKMEEKGQQQDEDGLYEDNEEIVESEMDNEMLYGEKLHVIMGSNAGGVIRDNAELMKIVIGGCIGFVFATFVMYCYFNHKNKYLEYQSLEY